MKSDKSEQVLSSAGPQRDGRGRFLVGHKATPTAGRPPGALNTITRSLREQVLAGFDRRGIEAFVEDLLDTSPPSAAALLTRLLPPEPVDDSGVAVVESVEIVSIPRGHYLLPADMNVNSYLFTEAEVAEVQAVQNRARERADSLRRTFMETDPPPDDISPNGA